MDAALSNPKLIFLSLIVFGVIFEVAGDILIKKWALAQGQTFLWVGLAIYLIGSAFWIFSLRYDYLSRAISIFTILNLILIVAAGVLFFNEQLSLGNKIGIALGIISVLLIELT
jgi:multidrug transporter EmrE-like cation transporter